LGLFVPVMPNLSAELIGYVLGILGSTHDPAAGPIIDFYTAHADSSVRAAAADALTELAGKIDVIMEAGHVLSLRHRPVRATAR
jgi:HEAT repeat protein